MKITVCIGSSCHMKGSKRVIDEINRLIDEKDLGEKVTLAGTFCSGNCQNGVCITVDGKDHSVTPETVEQFFAETVIPALGEE